MKFHVQDSTIRITAVEQLRPNEKLDNHRSMEGATQTIVNKNSPFEATPITYYFSSQSRHGLSHCETLNLKCLESNLFNALRQPTPYIVVADFENTYSLPSRNEPNTECQR